jgi:hypothetical protein
MEKNEGDCSFCEILQSPETASHRVRALLIRQRFFSVPYRIVHFPPSITELVLRGTHHAETELYLGSFTPTRHY